jgi:hypothetical protein
MLASSQQNGSHRYQQGRENPHAMFFNALSLPKLPAQAFGDVNLSALFSVAQDKIPGLVRSPKSPLVFGIATLFRCSVLYARTIFGIGPRLTQSRFRLWEQRSRGRVCSS